MKSFRNLDLDYSNPYYHQLELLYELYTIIPHQKKLEKRIQRNNRGVSVKQIKTMIKKSKPNYENTLNRLLRDIEPRYNIYLIYNRIKENKLLLKNLNKARKKRMIDTRIYHQLKIEYEQNVHSAETLLKELKIFAKAYFNVIRQKILENVDNMQILQEQWLTTNDIKFREYWRKVRDIDKRNDPFRDRLKFLNFYIIQGKKKRKFLRSFNSIKKFIPKKLIDENSKKGGVYNPKAQLENEIIKNIETIILVDKIIWYSNLKEIIKEMVNSFSSSFNEFLQKVNQEEVTWKDIQKKYSKRKIRDRLVRECNLRTLDATKTMSPKFKQAFIDLFGERPGLLYDDFIVKLWASPKRIDENRRKRILPKIREQLFSELEVFNRFFPDYKCSSIANYSKKYNINPNTMAIYFQEVLEEWILKRLKYPDNSKTFKKKFSEIWSFNWQEFQAKKIDLTLVQKFVDSRNSKLQTTLTQWDNLEDYPANRKVKIKCSKGHIFESFVSSLLIGRTWCYECKEYKCEAILCMFIDEIFNTKFKKQTNLKDVFGLSKNYSKKIVCDIKRSFEYEVNITRQTFDGFAVVKIKGTDINGYPIEKLIRIAVEYDGIQHDKYNKNYHRGNIINFYKQRCRDTAKDATAKDYDTIVIRVKESEGYDLSTLGKFHEEIVRQFQRLTGIKLNPMPRLYYDIISNKLKRSSSFVDIPLKDSHNQSSKSQRNIFDFV